MIRVIVKQVFRAVREIEIEVDRPDLESAIEDVHSGNVDLPSHEDPRWRTGWDLQNEEVIAA